MWLPLFREIPMNVSGLKHAACETVPGASADGLTGAMRGGLSGVDPSGSLSW